MTSTKKSHRARSLLLAVLAMLAVFTAVGLLPDEWFDAEPAPEVVAATPHVPSASVSDLAELLGQLAIDDEPAPIAYERDAFGPRWSDTDGNGCDQRNDVLARDLTDVEYRAGTRDCVVERGELHDVYTAESFWFEKTDGGIDIDHVVPLAAAWHSGAWAWSDQDRLEFANDPANLQATASSVNRSKGDRGPDQWMPESPAYTCIYLERWVELKSTWSLTVTSAERDALSDLTATC